MGRNSGTKFCKVVSPGKKLCGEFGFGHTVLYPPDSLFVLFGRQTVCCVVCWSPDSFVVRKQGGPLFFGSPDSFLCCVLVARQFLFVV